MFGALLSFRREMIGAIPPGCTVYLLGYFPCIVCNYSTILFLTYYFSNPEEARTGAGLTRGLTDWLDRVLSVAEQVKLFLPLCKWDPVVYSGIICSLK